MEEKAALTQRIERSNRSRKGKAVGGIVTLGLGVVGGGLCGLFQYLAVGPYEEYLAATVTGDAVSYREQFRTMEALSIVSAGVGGASLLTSTILWATRPKEGGTRLSSRK